MKSKLLLPLFVLFLIPFIQLPAQEKLPDSELVLIHEDVIFPYAMEKYEKAAKDFIQMLKDAKVERTIRTLQSEYTTYSYITPVEDYEGLAKRMGMGRDMVKKIGAEKFSQVMSEFDGCYASHKNFILKLRNDLSYKATYGMDPNDGLNFRHLDYLYIIPGKEQEMISLIKDYKALFEKKNIEEGYRVYIGDLGTDMPMILFVQPAKSRVDFASLSDKQDELLGDEGTALWKKAMSITQKFEHHNGLMRSDLFYSSK
jgi:hypothetical protein